MPKYVFKCSEGHKREVKMTFKEFDYFKLIGGVSCIECPYFGGGVLMQAEIQPTRFSITPGLYDDLKTGSVQEDQLRREGYW